MERVLSSTESAADVQASARDGDGVFADPSHNSSEFHSFPMKRVSIPVPQSDIKYKFSDYGNPDHKSTPEHDACNSKSRSSGSENLGRILDSGRLQEYPAELVRQSGQSSSTNLSQTPHLEEQKAFAFRYHASGDSKMKEPSFTDDFRARGVLLEEIKEIEYPIVAPAAILPIQN